MQGYRLIIKEMPEEERPRERLIKYGVASLTNSELLAILIRTGTYGENVLTLSQKLLKKYTIKSLSKQRISKLQDECGIGLAKACQLSAAFELGRRVSVFSDEKKKKIETAEDVFNLVKDEMNSYDREHVKGIYLNVRKQVVKQEMLFVGTLDASLIHPRDIFQVALFEGAAAIILVHNHPSGDPTPSDEDIEITKDIMTAGTILGIQVLDHVIIGNNSYCSLKENGYLL